MQPKTLQLSNKGWHGSGQQTLHWKLHLGPTHKVHRWDWISGAGADNLLLRVLIFVLIFVLIRLSSIRLLFVPTT